MTNKPEIVVEYTPPFRKSLKRLAKKYPHIQEDVQPVIEQLKNGETPGSILKDVGYTIYKVRVSNRDAKRGKSGGYRMLYYLRRSDYILLIQIYSKGELSDLSATAVQQLLSDLE